VPHCHLCGREIASQSLERIIDMVMLSPNDERVNVLAPVVRGRKGEFKKEASSEGSPNPSKSPSTSPTTSSSSTRSTAAIGSSRASWRARIAVSACPR
jgi:hypothetical protein